MKEEIHVLQGSLDTYRRRLKHHLDQQATFGASTPYAIARDIEDARDNIGRIKAQLHKYGIHTDDLLNDKAPADSSLSSRDSTSSQDQDSGSKSTSYTITTGDSSPVVTGGSATIHYGETRRWLLLSLLVVLVVLTAVVGIGFYGAYVRLPNPFAPMPDGGWNVALAEIGWDSGDGTARTDGRTAHLSTRIYSIIEQRVESGHSRRVAPLTGDRAERARQAAAIAASTNASVVVYGVLRPTTPGVGQFQLEFYISPNISSASVSVSEIIGTSQFGTPIEVTLNTTHGPDENAIEGRIRALEFVLNGINQYAAERYEPAHSELESALKALGPEEDGQAAAVIHEFMAATHLGAKRYDQALREVERAHQLWISYGRPYLTRAAIRYAQANALLPNDSTGLVIRLPQPMPHCFDNPPRPAPDLGWLLAEALACYDEALQAPDQSPDIELDDKVAYSKASIYVTLSFYGGGDYWNAALPLLEQVINHYQAAPTDEERQRLRRITAHAYARRGLLHFYAPGNTAESRAAAIGDYQAAIDLLERPEPGGDSCHDTPDTCYKSDRPFIEVYRLQLEQLIQVMEQSG